MVLTYLSPGDIARLSRTCKEMYDSVVDHLWQDIKTLNALIRLLPPYPRTQPLTMDDIERIDFYGRKVRRLDLRQWDGKSKLQIPQKWRTPRRKVQQQIIPASDKPWIELWEEIALLRPQTAFLPNLQFLLLIDNAAAEIIRPLIGISGVHLRRIYIKAIHEPKELLRKFLGSFERTPKLGYLYVRNGLYHIPDVLIGNSPLVTLRLDETVSWSHAPPLPLSRALLTKSSLECLTVKLHETWHDPEAWALDEKILPALRQLRLNLRGICNHKCQPHCDVCALLYDPLRRQSIASRPFHQGVSFHCSRRPRSVFIRALNHPKLELLNIKFDSDVDAALLHDTMYAVVEACRLDNLAELVLSNGGRIAPCSCHSGRNKPQVHRGDVQEMLKLLGPLPRLRVLRLPLACDFLRVLDVQDYERVAEALPSLQTLMLGHQSFTRLGQPYDRTPLKHIAAFCSLFPVLSDVEIGCVDATSLEGNSSPEWICMNVRRLRVNLWLRSNDLVWEQQMQQCRTYFPNADVNDKHFRLWQRV